MALLRQAERTGVLLIVLAVGAAGCGSSAKPKHRRPGTEATRTIAPSRTTVLARTRHSRAGKAPTTATTSPGTLTAPPPTPPGTPPAPDGLTQTTGYATYELCASDCSGAVPPALRRPLHLPALSSAGACPVAAGRGPVGLLGSDTELSMTPFIGSAWQGARVTWRSSASYQGPVLIRGRELGGPHAVGFGEGHVPYDELQLLGRAYEVTASPERQWPSFTRVRGPGCYAYQVDGTSFSEVIVFRATG
jgi:hypothetical protein